jgi:flagellar basal-body rod protein FlgB
MSFGILDSTSIPVLQEVICFSEARHAVLASNVANADTPGYRVRDLSVENFQQRLREAIEAQRQSHDPVSPGIVRADPDEALREVHESMQSILYHDDSNDGLEQQVLAISKNNLMHNMAISIMSSQFRLLQAAISERV